MKKKYVFIVLITLSIITGIILFLSLSMFEKEKVKETSLNTIKVKKQNIEESISSTGIIKPRIGADVNVGVQVSGVIEKIYVNIGDHVTKGKTMAKLNDLEYKAKFELSNATLKKAKADMEYAKINLERQKPLLNENLVSKQLIDQLENAYNSADALYQHAITNVNYAILQLSYTVIRAPINGVVASINKQMGESVASNTTAGEIFKIINLNGLEVNAYIDETDIGKMQEGLSAFFTIDTFSDVEFKGKVSSIYPAAVIVDNVVNYIASVSIDDNQGKVIRPEMTANVTISLKIKENILTIPTKSIRLVQGEKIVTVIKDGKEINRTIKTGIKLDGFTEITSGLNEGETIIIPN